MIELRGATAVEFDPPSVRENVDMRIDGPRIVDVARGGQRAADRRPTGERAAGRAEATVIDLDGALVTPGLVCAHHHLYSALARGLLAAVGPCPDFPSTLRNLWWRLDRALDGESLAAAGRVGCLEAIRAGTTAVIDHHASPSFIRGSLEVLKGCLEWSGLRGVLCYEVSDRNGEEGMRAGVEECLAFARRADEERRAGGVPRVEAMIGGHAPFTLSDRALRLLADAAAATGRGFHVHAAEDATDGAHSRAEHGREPLERLAAFGLLTPRAIVAHGVHLTPGDLERLNGADAFLAHNPRSNMNNRVGYLRVLEGVRNAALGTDGIGGDMLEELRFAWFKHRDAGGERSPQDFLPVLQGAHRLLERQFGERFGRLAAGYRADLVVWDYRPPTPLTAANLAGHLVYGLSGRDARTVIVDGRIVYQERRFPADLEAVYRETRECARRLWERMDRLGPG